MDERNKGWKQVKNKGCKDEAKQKRKQDKKERTKERKDDIDSWKLYSGITSSY